jgi:hypothetical protein
MELGRRRSKRDKIGKHVAERRHHIRVVDLATIPNNFAEWLEANNIDLRELAIRTGIRPYRLMTLRAGTHPVYMWESIVIEQATSGGFTQADWAKHPAVRAELTMATERQGVAMQNWMERRPFGAGFFVHQDVKRRMQQLFAEWLEIVKADPKVLDEVP